MAKCRDYKTHTDCPHIHKCTDPDEEVQVGTSMKKLQQHCFYCFKTPGVKKIAAVPSFTGRTPKWCPLGRDEEGRK